MKVRVDPELCTVCMTCVDDVPEVFEMGEEVAEAKTPVVPPELEDAVREVADACPAEAIIIE
jgi:ferredoxin